jgi:hypothetical protein
MVLVCVVSAPALVWRRLRGWSCRRHVWLSSVHRFEGLAGGRAWAAQGLAWLCPIRTSPHSIGDGSTALGMAVQGWRWPHRVGGDGRDALRSSCVTAPSRSGIRSVVVCLSRVSPDSFEGCGVEEGQEQVAQRLGMTPASPHSERTVPA